MYNILLCNIYRVLSLSPSMCVCTVLYNVYIRNTDEMQLNASGECNLLSISTIPGI